jgi:hypothetical protein
MNTIYKSSYTSVTEQNGIIIIKRRIQVILLIAALELAFGALSYFASRMQLFTDGALERLCFWAATILLPLAAFVIIIGILQGLKSRIIFDCNLRKMRKGFKIHDFSQIETFSLEKTPFADSHLFFLTAQVNGKQLRLASETTPETLEKVAGFLNRRLELQAVSFEPIKDYQKLAANGIGQRFIGILLVTLGVVWTGTGFFFLQRIIITGPRSEHGPLLWPLGIWIAGLGIGDLLGVPVYRLLKEGSGWAKVFVAVIYFGSYMLICWR